MTDRDLEFQGELRAWFRSEVTSEVAAPASLRTAMAAIPATVPGQTGYRRWILLAVVASALITLGSVTAIGSGLIRLPEIRPDLVPIGGPCIPKLDDALLLDAYLTVGYGGGGYFGEAEYFVYRDGLVLVTETRNGVPVYPLIRQRRLTAEGIDSLLTAATRPGLEGCRDVPLGDDTRHITFTVRDGSSVNELHVGYGPYSRADADAASTTAAAEMVRRVTDPDLGVPPDQWADDAWTEYVPNSYRVTVSFYDVPGNESPHEIWDHLLSDGSTLRTIGQPMEAPPSYGFQAMRCVEMNAADVRSLWEDLTTFLRPSDVGLGQYAGFHALVTGTSPENSRGGGDISADFTLPHQHPCTEVIPDESPDEPQNPDPALMSLDVCALIQGAELPDGHSLPADRTRWVSSDASICDFWDENDPSTEFYRISLRVWPTSATDALQLVRMAFGDGDFRTIKSGRATAYRNCDACPPAMVISADPYLLLIEGPGAGDPDAENILWALGETAMDHLPD